MVGTIGYHAIYATPKLPKHQERNHCFYNKQQCIYLANGKRTFSKTSSSPSLHMYMLVKYEEFFLSC